MEFLPTDYQEPVKSNYMSFEIGDNTFRVLDSAVTGWEYWTESYEDGEKKSRPHKVKEEGSIPIVDVVTNKFGNLNYSFFWAFPVYNFNARKIQILQIKQSRVRKDMLGYLRNKKWGDPRNYNFVVSREDLERTTYSVQVEPKEPLDESIIEKFKSMKLDMSVWFTGGDPFKKDDTRVNDVSETMMTSKESKDLADSMPEF